MGHGSWVMWVMGQLCNGSHGSWVTKDDPFPSLTRTPLTWTRSTQVSSEDCEGAAWYGHDDWRSRWTSVGSRTLRPQDTLAPRHFGATKLVPKFKTNHRWSCVSSELSWVEVSRLFLDHGTRLEVIEVCPTTFLVSKCLETGAEVSQCLDAEVSCNRSVGLLVPTELKSVEQLTRQAGEHSCNKRL